MNRRTLLTGLSVTTLGTAGCLGNVWPVASYCRSYVLSMDPVDRARVPERAARSETALKASPLVSKLVSRVLDGESIELEVEANHTLFRNDPQNTVYVEREGTFYNISREKILEGEVTGPRYTASRTDTPDNSSDRDAVSVEHLPFSDRWRLHDALNFPEYDAEEEHSFIAGYLGSDFQEESRLATGIGRETIKFDGEEPQYIELEEQGTGSEPAVRFRYSAEAVAEESEAFTEYILEQHAIEPSAAARELLKNVETEGEIERCANGETDSIEEASESERKAIDEFRSELAEYPATDGEILYIRYDGAVYELRVEEYG